MLIRLALLHWHRMRLGARQCLSRALRATQLQVAHILFKGSQHFFRAALAAFAPTLLRTFSALFNGRGHQHPLQGHFHFRSACLRLWGYIVDGVALERSIDGPGRLARVQTVGDERFEVAECEGDPFSPRATGHAHQCVEALHARYLCFTYGFRDVNLGLARIPDQLRNVLDHGC